MDRISQLVSELNLQPHPEGGFYKETYRSNGEISKEDLGEGFSGNRNYCTGIYFLLTEDNFSAFHRIKQDEMWHFYEGDPLRVHMINELGNYSFQDIGLNFSKGEQPQFTVPKNVWFASEVAEQGTYSLVGCTVAPGFDFDDFELASGYQLASIYPSHVEIIQRLTRV